MRLLSLIVAASMAMAGPLSAQSVALLIGNDDYDALPDVSRGGRITLAADDFEQAGMQTIALVGADFDEVQAALVQFGQMANEADTLLVGLSGRFVHSSTETYYMPSDAQAGPLATLHAMALPMSTVFAWLAAKPGKAVLVLSTDGSNPSYGPNLTGGVGELDIPQGVTVLFGNPSRTTDVMVNHLAQRGRPFIGAAEQAQVRVFGYAPRTMVFLDGAAPPPATANDRLADIRDWRAANTSNTAEAYQDYLQKHPNGEFARMAESRIEAMTDTPQARAERAEQALDLGRDARRSIQRNLTLLGYDTRGIDGIFGRGTRAAIARWQQAERFDATGFMTSQQVSLLSEQAERRAMELEAEAEERRQQQLVQDLNYWDQTGAVGDEAGLRAYLKRFPDGEYSELANERLAIFEEQKVNRANQVDRQLWAEASAKDTVQAYEYYVVNAPAGAFREEAFARIERIKRESQFTEAARAENAMNMSPRTRQTIEARLNSMGLRPGPIDGVFDDDTRRAIRRYQSARNMQETGYVSEAMVVQLMADSVRQIFR